MSDEVVLFRCKIPGRVRILKNGKKICRNRKTGRMFVTKSDQYAKWEAFACAFVNRAHRGETIDFPVNLSARFHLSNFQHQHDLTNALQSIEEVLQKCGVIKDDKLVISLDGSRKIIPADGDFVEIELTRAANLSGT